MPLAVSHPRPELEHAVADSGAAVLVAHAEFRDRLAPIAAGAGLSLLETGELLAGPEAAGGARAHKLGSPSPPTGPPLPAIARSQRAMILYTSSTTSRPKGVVTTHANLQAQIESLVEA